jgi:hypothetical protein
MTKGLAGYWISTEKLDWNADTNTFVGEASELGIKNFDKSYVIWNPKTNGSSFLKFDKFDKNGEEIAGARYSSHQGYKLLIIND